MPNNPQPTTDNHTACLFCQIINGKIPAKVRFEDNEFIVFDDIKPIAPTHVLLITKNHYKSLEDIEISDQKLHAQILITSRKVAKKLGISDNYKIFMNIGDQVQMIHHIHLHIYGGWNKNKTAYQLDKESLELINS